uniref:Uncharacterized protein n=2 Tax=Oryza TaxID=4527 RepID=A0A0D9Z6S2_9ORYZ
MARHSSIKGAHPSCPEIRLKLTVHRRPPTSSPLSELTRPASALQFGSVPEFGSRGEWGNGGSRDAVPPPLRDPRAVPRRAAPRRRRVRAPARRLVPAEAAAPVAPRRGRRLRPAGLPRASRPGGEAEEVPLPGGERQVHAGRGGALPGAAEGEAAALRGAGEGAGLLAGGGAQVPRQVPQHHQAPQAPRRRARLHRRQLDHFYEVEARQGLSRTI